MDVNYFVYLNSEGVPESCYCIQLKDLAVLLCKEKFFAVAHVLCSI